MILSANFFLDTNRFFREQFRFSRNLYNQGRYLILKHYEENKTFITDTALNRILREYKDEFNNYRKLCKAKVSQMILINLKDNFKAYFKSLKEHKKNPNKFKGVPKPPKYKDRPNALYFDYQSAKIKDQFIIINKEIKVHIPSEIFKEELRNFKTIKFIPFGNKIKVSISYETKELNPNLNKDDYLSIDLGMNNLCSCVSRFESFIINGKVIKAINQFFNKNLAKLKSERPLKGEFQDKEYNHSKISKLSLKRDLKIADILHKASKYLVNYCVSRKIGTIVLGRNKDWKDSINLGKKTNQNFVSVPFYKFINMLEYKCKMSGIIFAEQEESYTSKCDSLAFEEIKKHKSYKGKRTYRGLFISSVGKAINADINGAINILRKFLKVVGKSPEMQFIAIREIIDRGLPLNPYRINFY